MVAGILYVLVVRLNLIKIKEYGILRETHTPTVTSLCAIYLIFAICRVAVCPLWLLLTCPTSDRQRMQGMITASH